MLLKKRYVLWICMCLLGVLRSKAQVNLSANALIYSTDEQLPLTDTTSYFNIKDVYISGNVKTQSSTILRELSFRKDDQYPLSELVNKFLETKRQLMNTGLFRSVVVSLKSMSGYDVAVAIDVTERWYIYPIPFVKMVDRNINEWVVQQKMSLSRVNYGLKLTHRNTTGRNDRLYVNLANGFTKQVAVRYDNLYLDRAMKWSTNLSVAFGKNHEVVYNTINDKQVAYKSNDAFVHSFFRSALEVSYRRAIKTRHTFGVGYNYEDVADTLFNLNPSYASQQKVIRYPEFSYRMQHFNVDFKPYPTKGYVTDVSLVKKGLNGQINLWQLSTKASAYWPLSEKYTFNLRMAGMLKLPFRQTFINKQFLGYNDLFMQGYEYNVIDGVAGGYGKATLSRQIVNTTFHIPSKRIERLNNVPFALYAKVYGNTGYVYNPDPGDNQLTNRWLCSGGAGLDIVLFSDFVFKIEWSLNQLGQKGVYLHKRDYF